MVGFAYPEISPVIFSVGPLAVRWYSMAYLGGILLGWWLTSARNKKYQLGLSSGNIEDLAFYFTLGVILGGRFGYVLFYGSNIFWKNPLEIFAIWHGGMSFHGGIIGVIIALYFAARNIKQPYLKITDIVSPLVPIGIFLGRLANFVNDELWGRITDAPWAIRFPRGGYEPRHPSQLYEAFCEGIILFIILNLMWRSKWCRERTGLISSAFLLGYASFRALLEQFRQPDAQIGFLWGGITMGQLLSAPLIFIGIYLLWQALRKPMSKPL